MKNVLVTGGAGFIGSNFVRFLQKQEPDIRVITLDALTYAGSLDNLKDLPTPDRHIFLKGNICDSEFVSKAFTEFQVDTVVHFAAETHVDRSILGPGQFIQTNIVGTFTLLEAARKSWSKNGNEFDKPYRFHHVSTDEVFGALKANEPAWIEETPYSPNSPYSASKASSDHLVRAYHHTYGLPISITNCSNNYGPNQFPEKLIPLMIVNALTGKALPVYGDGQQIRDWLYVEDHCEAIWMVIKEGKSGETYNIGGNNQPANLDIVNRICEIMDQNQPDAPYYPHKSLITYVKDRPGHDRRYAMDITKISKELGWKPRHTLEEGLRETVGWYLSHPEWLVSISDRSDLKDWIARNYIDRDKGGVK